MGVSNLGLRTYNLVAGVTGEAKLIAYISVSGRPPGWLVQYETTYGWAKPLFGDTSVWNRYILRAERPGPLRTNVPVVADVINTPDLSSFSAYGVENCYTFHGYALADVAQVSLAGGITGQAMSYTSQQFGSWSIVYWIVPVKMGWWHQLRAGRPVRPELRAGCSGQGLTARRFDPQSWRERSTRRTGRTGPSSTTGPSWWPSPRQLIDTQAFYGRSRHIRRPSQPPITKSARPDHAHRMSPSFT